MKALMAAAVLALACGTAAAQTGSLMDLTIDNRTGVDDAHVFVMAISGNGTGYFAFPTDTWVTLGSWQFDAAAMTSSLADVRARNTDHSTTLHMPAIDSARLYFAVGRNF